MVGAEGLPGDPSTVTRIRIYGPMDYTHFQLWPDMFFATYDLDGTRVSGGSIGTFANVEAAVPRPDGRYAVAGFGAPTQNGGTLPAPDSFAIGLEQPNTHIQFPGSTDSHAFALALTPDGGAVAAGQALISGAGRIALAKVTLPATPVRYNANGSLDTSFGGDGIVTTLFPAVAGQIPGGIVRTADNRLVVGGSWRSRGRSGSGSGVAERTGVQVALNGYLKLVDRRWVFHHDRRLGEPDRLARGPRPLQSLVRGLRALLEPAHALGADRLRRIRPGAVQRQALAVVGRLGGELREVCRLYRG
jgi:hypothetical protein